MEKEMLKNEKEYSKIYDLSLEEIKALPRLSVNLSKQVSKKNNSVRFVAACNFKLVQLIDKKFNQDKFVMTLMEQKYDIEKIPSVTSCNLNAPYRLVTGIRRDNQERFHGIDVIVSSSYRPRLFFNDMQLKIVETVFKTQGLKFEFVEVESNGYELEAEVE